jgi:hypothetical protein
MKPKDCKTVDEVAMHLAEKYAYMWGLTEADIPDAKQAASAALQHIAKLEYQRGLDEAAERERVLRGALADAIRHPMGVIPTSAEGLLTTDELDAAEKRRVATEPKEVK